MLHIKNSKHASNRKSGYLHYITEIKKITELPIPKMTKRKKRIKTYPPAQNKKKENRKKFPYNPFPHSIKSRLKSYSDFEQSQITNKY